MLPLLAGAILATACGTDSTAPTSPSSPSDAVVASLTAMTPTAFSLPAGAYVTDLPSVIVRNARGQPLSGVLVKFETVTPGTSPYASPPSPQTTYVSSVNVLTTANGIAVLPPWRISTATGVNTVTASAGSAPRVSFSVNALPGSPALLRAAGGDNQVVPAGTAPTTQPQALVLDEYGNPVPKVPVSFSVTAGGGTLADGSAMTDANGIAPASSWTVGESGTQTLLATVNLPVGTLSVSFTAVADSASVACGAPTFAPLGATLHASLSTASCQSDGKYYDIVTITTAHYRAYNLTLDSPDFDTSMELIGDDKIAENDDTSSTSSHMKVMLAEGTYSVRISSHRPGALGKYSLSFTGTSETLTDCVPLFATRGISTYQSFGKVDCVETGTHTLHRFHVYVAAGRALTAIMDAEDPYNDYMLTARSSDGSQIIKGTGTYFRLSLTFIAAASGYYYVEVSSPDEDAAYSLSLR